VTAVLAVCVVLGAALIGCALHDLQTWLERWDYDRHAND
jgi:hypothetical protein